MMSDIGNDHAAVLGLSIAGNQLRADEAGCEMVVMALTVEYRVGSLTVKMRLAPHESQEHDCPSQSGCCSGLTWQRTGCH